jgi:hypothetical protein
MALLSRVLESPLIMLQNQVDEFLHIYMCQQSLGNLKSTKGLTKANQERNTFALGSSSLANHSGQLCLLYFNYLLTTQ